MDQRPGDITNMEYTLRVLKEQHTDALNQANKWGVKFDVRIQSTPEFCIVVSAANNGRMYIKNIHLNDVRYFSDDPNALVNEVAEATYNALLKDMLRDELRDPLKKALINCNRMASL
jgi:hypothetical protein